jgi:hypothetical protein
MNYKPIPIDTSRIILSQDLLELTELFTENAHDNWAKQRLSEDWTFGSKRDDLTKEHPCLVPYEELPESEKEYDRLAAMETLKSIHALGYMIVKLK